MNKPTKIENYSSKLENIENMSASDILDYFNKNIFPKIKNKYFSFPVRTKRAISELFSKQKEMNLFYRHEGSINKRF